LDVIAFMPLSPARGRGTRNRIGKKGFDDFLDVEGGRAAADGNQFDPRTVGRLEKDRIIT